jgi:hypothetical protein
LLSRRRGFHLVRRLVPFVFFGSGRFRTSNKARTALVIGWESSWIGGIFKKIEGDRADPGSNKKERPENRQTQEETETVEKSQRTEVKDEQICAPTPTHIPNPAQREVKMRRAKWSNTRTLRKRRNTWRNHKRQG